MPVAAPDKRTDDHLEWLRSDSHSLIAAEAESLNRRSRMERRIIEAISVGIPVEAISEATGLRVEDIDRIVAKNQRRNRTYTESIDTR
jgi:hypothetical protein